MVDEPINRLHKEAVILSEGPGSPSRAAFARDGVAEGSQALSPAWETRVEGSRFWLFAISAPPPLNFPRPIRDRRSYLVQLSFEEMIAALDPDHLFRLRHCVKNLLQLCARAIPVARAADE